MKRMTLKKLAAHALAVIMALSLAVPAAAADGYTYKATFYAGGQGTFTQAAPVYVNNYRTGSRYTVERSADGSRITVSGLAYGDVVSLDAAAYGAVNVKPGTDYYVKGVRDSGSDNAESGSGAFRVYRDRDFVVAYGMRGEQTTYLVRFQDAEGNTLAPSRTYTGNVGDKPIAAYEYIEGYMPLAYNLTKTLSSNAADNTMTFIYKEVEPPEKIEVHVPGEVTVVHIPGKTYDVAVPGETIHIQGEPQNQGGGASDTGPVTQGSYYVLNNETMVYHLTTCGYLPTENEAYSPSSAASLEANGFRACEKCNPTDVEKATTHGFPQQAAQANGGTQQQGTAQNGGAQQQAPAQNGGAQQQAPAQNGGTQQQAPAQNGQPQDQDSGQGQAGEGQGGQPQDQDNGQGQAGSGQDGQFQDGGQNQDQNGSQGGDLSGVSGQGSRGDGQSQDQQSGDDGNNGPEFKPGGSLDVVIANDYEPADIVDLDENPSGIPMASAPDGIDGTGEPDPAAGGMNVADGAPAEPADIAPAKKGLPILPIAIGAAVLGGAAAAVLAIKKRQSASDTDEDDYE